MVHQSAGQHCVIRTAYKSDRIDQMVHPTQIEYGLFLTQMDYCLQKVDVCPVVANWLAPAMKTVTLAITQVGLDIPDALGVIGNGNGRSSLGHGPSKMSCCRRVSIYARTIAERVSLVFNYLSKK